MKTQEQAILDALLGGQVIGRHKIFIGNNQYENDWNFQLCQELIKMFKSLDIKNQLKYENT